MASFTLRTLGPLHIGDGDKYIPAEFYYDNGILNVLPYERIKSQLTPDTARRLASQLSSVLSGSNTDTTWLRKFYETEGVLNTVLAKSIALRVHDAQGISSVKEVRRNLRSLSQPYVPGTELKGAIVTALVSVLATSSKPLQEKLIDALRKLPDPPSPGSRDAHQYRSRYGHDIKSALAPVTDMVLGPLAQPAEYQKKRPNYNYSAARFIETGDSQPVDERQLFLARVRIAERFANEARLDDKAIIYEEALKADTDLASVKLRVTPNLFTKNGNFQYNLAKVLRNDISDPAALSTEEVSLNKLLGYLCIHAQALIAQEIEYFKSFEMQATGEAAALARDTLDHLLLVRQQNAPTSPVVRLGANEGMFGTTLMLAVKKLGDDKIGDDKLAADKLYTKAAEIGQVIRGATHRVMDGYPITRRACKAPGGKYQSLGWCKLVPEGT